MSETSGFHSGAHPQASGFGAQALWDAPTVTGITVDIDARADELHRISHEIWLHPEVGYQERFAAHELTGYLEQAGFAVERGVLGMDTAFVAHAGSGPITIGIVAEYDALPELGHACGHNLFCTAAVGAADALARWVERAGIAARVSVFGTPAEEGATVPNGSGKVPFVEAGLFDDVDIALMAHGAGETLIEKPTYAGYTYDVTFAGEAAHAGGSPWLGRNAQAAGVLLVNNINAVRQQLPPEIRLNPVFTGGTEVANTIPARAELKVNMRADTSDKLDGVIDAVERSVQAAALVTQTTPHIEPAQHRLDDLVPNHELALVWARALDELGEPYVQRAPRSGGCWDLGNVSHRVPTVGGYFKIGPHGLVGHTPAFRAAADSDQARSAVTVASKTMALVGAAYIHVPEVRTSVRAEFSERFAHA